ncbi:MAG TPA: hypothetical protein VNI54_18885 [Thermoanaerobaculia bacterium]|nr:hypothetical protein [Thermoanaerobaculia bacterium]
MKRSLALLIVITVACGKRGDPKPPVPVIPAATTDLVVTQRADRVLLSWSYPALSTAGRSLAGIRRISIYRYEEALPVAPGGRDPQTLMPGDVDPTEPQPIVMFSKVPTIAETQFAKLSKKIESIEKANLAGATVGSRLLFSDTPPFRSSDGRPVRLTYAVVTEGDEARSQTSNLAILVPLPVSVPPANVKAAAKAEGVTLSWTAPTTSVAGQSGPVITGYNIYRNAPGASPGELPVPVNSAPIKGTTYEDAPAYGEHEYRVAAVATTGPPAIQSDLSAPVRVTFKDLVPPPVPVNLNALVETKLVRLLWDPVTASDLAGYNVYRIEGRYRLKLTPAPTKDTNFLDISIDIGIFYTYEVTAVDASGNESVPSSRTEPVTVPKTP